MTRRCSLSGLWVSALLLGTLSAPTSALASPLSALPSSPSSNERGCQWAERADFTSAVERASPSVVSLAAGERVNNKLKLAQAGTGVVWAPGLILTNTHVIKGQPEVRARTYERRVVLLKEVARYERLDISLLRAQHEGALGEPPPIEKATQEPRVGAWVAAIGHPYDMYYSLSVGVLSALHRDLNSPPWRGVFPGFHQSDLTLNPGNSGGPLINPCGEMIGLNTAVMGEAQGVSLSLPLSRLTPVVERLLSEGRFEPSYVGLTLKYVSFKRAQRAGLPPLTGVRVKLVAPQGPGQRAGLRANDIIVSVEGKAYDSETELSWRLISTPPERPLSLEVARPHKGGAPERLTLTLTPVHKRERFVGPPSLRP